MAEKDHWPGNFEAWLPKDGEELPMFGVDRSGPMPVRFTQELPKKTRVRRFREAVARWLVRVAEFIAPGILREYE